MEKTQRREWHQLTSVHDSGSLHMESSLSNRQIERMYSFNLYSFVTSLILCISCPVALEGTLLIFTKGEQHALILFLIQEQCRMPTIHVLYQPRRELYRDKRSIWQKTRNIFSNSCCSIKIHCTKLASAAGTFL